MVLLLANSPVRRIQVMAEQKFKNPLSSGLGKNGRIAAWVVAFAIVVSGVLLGTVAFICAMKIVAALHLLYPVSVFLAFIFLTGIAFHCVNFLL